jgi:hypothetical protein
LSEAQFAGIYGSGNLIFEGIRSERKLMKIASDRLSVRWHLGYDLNEPLPDHFKASPGSASAMA